MRVWRVVTIDDELHLKLYSEFLVLDPVLRGSVRSFLGVVADSVELPTRSLPQPLPTLLAQ